MKVDVLLCALCFAYFGMLWKSPLFVWWRVVCTTVMHVNLYTALFKVINRAFHLIKCFFWYININGFLLTIPIYKRSFCFYGISVSIVSFSLILFGNNTICSRNNLLIPSEFRCIVLRRFEFSLLCYYKWIGVDLPASHKPFHRQIRTGIKNLWTHTLCFLFIDLSHFLFYLCEFSSNDTEFNVPVSR